MPEEKMVEHVYSATKGALSALKEVATGERRLSEFNLGSINFNVKESIVPKSSWDDGFRTLLELRASSSFTTFRSDRDSGVQHARRNAYRQMVSFLYDDVSADLRLITEAVGDGKRVEALGLLDALYRRLHGE